MESGADTPHSPRATIIFVALYRSRSFHLQTDRFPAEEPPPLSPPRRILQNRPFQTFNRWPGILWSTDFSLLFFGSWLAIPWRELRRLSAVTSRDRFATAKATYRGRNRNRFLLFSIPIATPTIPRPQPRWGWTNDYRSPPRVAAPTRQPWAKGRNPVGIPDRFKIPRRQIKRPNGPFCCPAEFCLAFVVNAARHVLSYAPGGAHYECVPRH